ncbi:MAG: hypothetical protein AAGA85_05385 [Bacteroidota bacterium]
METEIGQIEIVIFNTKAGHTQQEARAALETLNDCVMKFEGFIERKLAINEKGQWIDIVYWQSQAQALKAAEDIMKDPKALKAFDIIEEEQMQMFHFTPVSTFKNELITTTR